MELRLGELRYREVIDAASGERMGYVSDVLIDSTDGRVVALVVPGNLRWMGLLGREEDLVLPWSSITRLGDDIVLINGGAGLRRPGKK